VAIRGNMERFSGDLSVLEEILENFEGEEIEWDCALFRNPLFMLDDPNRLLSDFMLLSIDRNTLESEELYEFRRESIEVSAKDPTLMETARNAFYFKRDLIIRDVDEFSYEVYAILKHKMGMHSSLANNSSSNNNSSLANNGNSTNNTTSSNNTSNNKIIIQFNSQNPFKEETFELNFKEKFKVQRVSPLAALETELIKQLNQETPNLREILQCQTLLARERAQLREEERTRAVYGVMNRSYWELTGRFAREYGFGLSFGVFKGVVEFSKRVELTSQQMKLEPLTDQQMKLETLSDQQMKLEAFINNFFAQSLLPPPVQFGLDEITRFPFDYVFITSFNDILFQLKSLISFDLEISAGSPLCNKGILELLSEHSNKTVLVKNIHFLPAAQKTGTNRFFYTIEPGFMHPLMVESRIVKCDRMGDFETIYNGFKVLFGGDSISSMSSNVSSNVLPSVSSNNSTVPLSVPPNSSIRRNELIKFHAAVMHLKLDFSIKDLDLCIKNDQFSNEFLLEMIYYSRMEKDEIEKVRDILASQ